MEEVAKVKLKDGDETLEGGILPGFRFHPTDEELVGFYLPVKVEKKKISARSSTKLDQLIRQIDIYKYDPWDLPISTVGDKECYFYCRRGRKYRNSVRPNRVTGSGFWKATGIDKPIYSSKQPLACIGLKKSLVFYRGSAGKGTKTDWMMNEFRLPPNGKGNNNFHNAKVDNNIEEAEVWTLCRIFKRIPSYKKYTPNWKEEEATPTKHNPTHDSNSNEAKHMEISNHWFDNNVGQFGSYSLANHAHPQEAYSFTTSYNDGNSILMRNELSLCETGDFFGGGIGYWDELRPVVQLAVDPSTKFTTTVYR